MSELKVNAIIVAYNPNIDSLNVLINSLKSIELIILFKNSDFDYVSNANNLKQIRLDKNVGTAFAYNFCLNYLKADCEFVLILDQDTLLDSSCLSELIIQSDKLRTVHDHFIISPVEIDQYGLHRGWGSLSRFNYKKTEVRASGMFVSRRTFGILKFDETLFLDYVDWDFCWRASKSHEVLIFKSNKAKIFHQLGSSYLTHWGLSINTMAPSRIYFQIVNTKKLLFKSHVGLLNRLLLFVRIFKFIFISWIYKDFLARYYFIFSAIFNSDISKHLK